MAWPIIAAAGLAAASNLTSGLISSALGKSNANQLSEDQFQREMHLYRNRYRWTMEDMKAAGLNPILASSGGFGASSAHAQSSGGPSYPNFGTISASAKDFAQISKISTEKEKIAAETIKTFNESAKILVETQRAEEQIYKTRAETNLIKSHKTKIDSETTNIQKEERNILHRYWNLKAEFLKTIADAKLSLEKRDLTTVQTQHVKADIQKLFELSNKIKQETVKLKKIADVYRGPAGSTLATINETLSALKTHFAIIMGPLNN